MRYLIFPLFIALYFFFSCTQQTTNKQADQIQVAEVISQEEDSAIVNDQEKPKIDLPAYRTGLLLPSSLSTWKNPFLYIPEAGIPLYAASGGSSARTLVPWPESADRPDLTRIKFKGTEGESEIPVSRLEEVGYEISALAYSDEKEGFLKILDEYWVKEADLAARGLRKISRMDFLIEYSDKLLGYYPNDPGLRIRKGPSTDFEIITTLRTDKMEISLTKETKGLWVKVSVKEYKEHPCLAEGDLVILNTYEGWIKLLDDSGEPNVYYYARGC